MEKSSKLLSLLNSLFSSSGTDTGKGELVYFCPFCNHHKKKLDVNIATGQWHCWVCDAKGKSVFTLIKKAGGSKEYYAQANEIYQNSTFKKDKSVVNNTIVLPKEFMTLYGKNNSITFNHAKNYLLKRNVSEYDIVRYNIGYCIDGKYGGRIIVPSYSSDGILNYFIGRSFYNSPLKYKNPPASKNTIIFDLYINWKMPIILCEGVFDAIAIKRNAIPLLGKTVQDKLLEKIVTNRISDVIICLDSDALETSNKICNQLLRYGINVSKVTIKGGDPADIGYQGMIRKIKKKVHVDEYSILKERLL
jgi:DNA primase